MWCITLIDLQILKNPCIPGIKPTWSWFKKHIYTTVFRGSQDYLHFWYQVQIRRFLKPSSGSIICWKGSSVQFSSVQSLSQVWLFATPWIAARQTSLSITNSQSLLKLGDAIKSVMPFNHLILCRSLLLLPSIFPSIRVFSNESVLHIRWPN